MILTNDKPYTFLVHDINSNGNLIDEPYEIAVHPNQVRLATEEEINPIVDTQFIKGEN